MLVAIFTGSPAFIKMNSANSPNNPNSNSPTAAAQGVPPSKFDEIASGVLYALGAAVGAAVYQCLLSHSVGPERVLFQNFFFFFFFSIIFVLEAAHSDYKCHVKVNVLKILLVLSLLYVASK